MIKYTKYQDFDDRIKDASQPLLSVIMTGEYSWPEVIRFLRVEAIKRASRKHSGNKAKISRAIGLRRVLNKSEFKKYVG